VGRELSWYWVRWYKWDWLGGAVVVLGPVIELSQSSYPIYQGTHVCILDRGVSDTLIPLNLATS
jgi:hypothetical protein